MREIQPDCAGISNPDFFDSNSNPNSLDSKQRIIKSDWITVFNEKHPSTKKGRCKAEIDRSQMTTTKGKKDLWRRRIAQLDELEKFLEHLKRKRASATQVRKQAPTFGLWSTVILFFQVTEMNFNGWNWGDWLHLGSWQARIVEFVRDDWRP